MKKFIICLLCVFFGLAIGAGATYYVLGDRNESEVLNDTSSSPLASVEPSLAVDSSADNADLIAFSFEIAQIIKNNDFAALSELVHPEYGIVFVPYSTVNLASDQCFTADEVAGFGSNDNSYIWGINGATGETIDMTILQYFERYVFNLDFTAAPIVGVNQIVQSGNSLENVTEIFPDAVFVDLNFPGTERFDGMDWSTLRLVFEDYNGSYMLTAIIHSEWTI